MNYSEAMQTLEALGTEQNRKIYARHEVKDPIFGVSYANFGALKKKIKTDHALAKELWAGGVHDARVLATMIADPQQADEALLDAWVRDLSDYGLTDALVDFTSKTSMAQAKAEQWMRSEEEYISRAGWHLLGRIALNDPSKSEDYFTPYLAEIESDIHTRQNRVREAMNNALIAIGGREEPLKSRALAAARAVGEVYVDHGETNCKTPHAITYIEKMHARKAAKLEKARA